ncbi:MAG: hypothetical protein B7Z53_00755 [Rhodospirillales bacterium 12-71-4]|nr:MAG: hypothetical protein B7Z53_00755 [Rhodospirillales bacterium 12-71-4]
MDVSRGERIGRVSSEWFSRPDDERYLSLVAPIILGSGIPAFTLPAAGRIDQGLRFAWTPHRIGADMLFDIALHRAQPGICCEGPTA